MAFIDDLLELVDSTIIVRQGTVSGDGTWTHTGTDVELPCRYEQGMRMVQDSGGQLVQSTLFCMVMAPLPAWSPRLLRFNLPADYIPNENVRAFRCDPVRDETGIIAAEVSLP